MDLLEQGQRSHVKDHRDETPLLSVKAERVGVVQPGQEKAAGRR